MFLFVFPVFFFFIYYYVGGIVVVVAVAGELCGNVALYWLSLN